MKKLAKIAVPILAVCCTAAHAEIRFNGFASIHLSSLNSDNGASPFGQYEEGNTSFKDESLFAIQASSDLGEGLSATVQLVAEGQDDYEVDARWAYLSYSLNDEHTLSAGRFANPIFYQSEYEKVGFAHNYARLPKAVYIGFDFSTIEGIAIDSNYYIGDYTLSTKFLYGNWDGSVFLSATGQDEYFQLKNLFSGRATLAGDGWNIFAGSFIAELDGGTIDQNAIAGSAAPGIAAAQALGASQAEIDTFLDAITWGGKDGIYSYLGFNVDRNSFLVDFEYSSYGVKDSSDGWNDTWFFAVGYRLSDTVAVILHTEDYKEDGKDTDFLNGVNNPVLFATGAAIKEALSAVEFKGNGLTMRYDFHPSATLKADYFMGESTRADVGDYSIFTVGIDLVF